MSTALMAFSAFTAAPARAMGVTTATVDWTRMVTNGKVDVGEKSQGKWRSQGS